MSGSDVLRAGSQMIITDTPSRFLNAVDTALKCSLYLHCSSPAEEDLAFAASCAAFFSKARNEGKVPVAKALVSDLSKPSGAAPGKACLLPPWGLCSYNLQQQCLL